MLKMATTITVTATEAAVKKKMKKIMAKCTNHHVLQILFTVFTVVQCPPKKKKLFGITNLF